jgi:hypothetical protein
LPYSSWAGSEQHSSSKYWGFRLSFHSSPALESPFTSLAYSWRYQCILHTRFWRLTTLPLHKVPCQYCALFQRNDFSPPRRLKCHIWGCVQH